MTYEFVNWDEMPILTDSGEYAILYNDGVNVMLRTELKNISLMKGDFEEGSLHIVTDFDTMTITWSKTKHNVDWDLQISDGHGFSSTVAYNDSFVGMLMKWKETYDLLSK